MMHYVESKHNILYYHLSNYMLIVRNYKFHNRVHLRRQNNPERNYNARKECKQIMILFVILFLLSLLQYSYHLCIEIHMMVLLQVVMWVSMFHMVDNCPIFDIHLKMKYHQEQ